MKQSTKRSSKKSFYQLIDNFRNDFEDILSEEFNVELKLFILQCHIRNYSTTEIKGELLKLTKERDYNQFMAIIESYLKKDGNKILRISKYTTANDLIYLIQIINLCRIIIHKYPLPMLVGFPFEDNWKPEYLKKYICLYFGVKRRTINLNSLENYFQTQDWIDKTFLNENMWKNEDFDFSILYYLYIRFGKLSSKEVTSSHKNNRYVFATLIEFCNGYIGPYNDKYVFKQYRRNNKHHNTKHKTTLDITLYDILNQLLKYYDDPIKPTIIINFESIKNFKKRSFYSLKKLPPYIFVDAKLLSEVPLKTNESLNVKDKIKEIQSSLDAITLKRASDKSHYFSEMTKKIKEWCGDD